jgi:hypothetical protein
MKTKRKWIWTIVVLLIVVVLGAAAFAVGSRFGYRGGFERFGMMERGYNHMQPFNRPLLGDVPLTVGHPGAGGSGRGQPDPGIKVPKIGQCSRAGSASRISGTIHTRG